MQKVPCRTPAEGREGVTNIPAWKFDLLRGAIHEVLGTAGEVAFGDLNDRVRAGLDPDELERLGSLGWHVTTVKLELEVRGEIERVPGKRPQKIRLAT